MLVSLSLAVLSTHRLSASIARETSSSFLRGLGNFNGYKFEAPDQLTHSKTYFAIMQVREFLDEAEKILVQ